MRFAFTVVTMLLLLPFGRAREIQLSEEQAKAVYLVNLTKYIDWPSQVFGDESSPIIICVLGEQSLREEISKLAAAVRTTARPIRVQPFDEATQSACHMLFISASEKRRTPEIIGPIRDHSTLTISETDTFLQAGGIINLVRHEKKLRLQVSLTAAERARIKISSRLLQVSDVVDGKAKS